MGICTDARYAVLTINFYCHDKVRVSERDREQKGRDRDREWQVRCVAAVVFMCEGEKEETRRKGI